MPLKNTLESEVIENHATAICCGLSKEGKNGLFQPGTHILWSKIQNAEVIDLSKYNGHFVRVHGKIEKIQQLRKGAQLIFLKHKRMKKGLPGYQL